MDPLAPILLADFLENFLRVVLPLVFVAIWVLGKVLGNRNQPAQPPGGAPQQPRKAPQNVAGEIESFLRQVTRQRGDQPPQEVEVLEPELPAKERPPLRLAPIEVKPLEMEPIEVELVPDEPRRVLPSFGKVGSHVEEHIGSSSFAEEVSHLGEEVDQADEKVEERIHEKFDHDVGHLAQADAARADKVYDRKGGAYDRKDENAWKEALAEKPVAMSASLADVLKNPAGVRQAIILSEILRPPLTER